MAYVRKRTTKAGSVSTMLVEAYRDKSGHPRQRILANMHGEPDTLRALAKLAAMREGLRQERDWLAQQAADASGLIHSGDSQMARSSSSSRHESRNCRQRHPSGPPSTSGDRLGS